MKKINQLLIGFIVALGFSAPAYAGIHIEPFISYAVSGEVGGTPTIDYGGGPLFGGRLGYGMLGFFAAAEYEMGTLTQESTPEVDLDVTNLGVSVGYEFPILLRIYGTYIVDSKGTTDTTPEIEYSGDGVKLGIGYTGLPFVAINFEMTKVNLDEAKVSGITTSQDIDTTTYAIGVSLPLNL